MMDGITGRKMDVVKFCEIQLSNSENNHFNLYACKYQKKF